MLMDALAYLVGTLVLLSGLGVGLNRAVADQPAANEYCARTHNLDAWEVCAHRPEFVLIDRGLGKDADAAPPGYE